MNKSPLPQQAYQQHEHRIAGLLVCLSELPFLPEAVERCPLLYRQMIG